MRSSSAADPGTPVCSVTPLVVSSLPNASVGCRILFKSLFCGGLGRLQDRPTPERLYGSTLYHSVAPAWRRRPIGTVGRRRLRSPAPGGRRQRAIAIYRAKRRHFVGYRRQVLEGPVALARCLADEPRADQEPPLDLPGRHDCP